MNFNCILNTVLCTHYTLVVFIYSKPVYVIHLHHRQHTLSFLFHLSCAIVSAWIFRCFDQGNSVIDSIDFDTHVAHREISLCMQCTLINGKCFEPPPVLTYLQDYNATIYKANSKQIHSFDDTSFPVVVYVNFGSCHVSFLRRFHLWQSRDSMISSFIHWHRSQPSNNQSNYVEITHQTIVPKFEFD